MKAKPIKRKKSPSHLENMFMAILRANTLLHHFEREYRFHPERKWRFDFANPHMKVAVEIEGGAFSGGRHTRGAGFVADCEKYNQATVLGWRVLRYPSVAAMASFPDDYDKILNKAYGIGKP